jgi:hypothetical protein
MTDNPPSRRDQPIVADEPRWQDHVEPAPSAQLACTRAKRSQGTSYRAFRDAAPPSDDDPLLDFAPVPHKQVRRNTIGPERQRAFIAHLAATGIVKQAALHIGASLEALYKLRKRPGAEEFDRAWDAAIDRSVARLEDSALARAIEGEERLVVSAGKVLGTERRHNEALVMFLLRQRRAERYGSDIRPGHPLYVRIRAEVLAEMCGADGSGQRDEQAILDALDAKLSRMQERQEAAQRLLLEGPGNVRKVD